MVEPCRYCNGTGQHNPYMDMGNPLNRALFDSYFYQAELYKAWRALRQQQKGLNRQRKLIRRLQAQRKADAATADE